MAKEPKEPLTPREEEVLALLRRGLTNAQLASDLGISENTAKDHVSSILYKLDAKTRDEAAYWPQRAPWWARAPLIAPLALLLRRSSARPPFSPSTAATALAGTALVVVIGGLSLLAFLLLRTDSSETPGFASNDIRDLQPGMTVHTIEEKYRRYGPAADIYAEHFPENGSERQTTEAWWVFDEDGGLADFRSETRTEEGALHASATMEEADIVHRDADGVETWRIPGTYDTTAVDLFRERIIDGFDQLQEELDEHSDAPLVILDGTEFLLIENRSAFTWGSNGPAAPSSFSAPYFFGLHPVEMIHRQYVSPTLSRYRSEDWAVNSDGVETLLESSDSVLLEILKN